MAGLGCSHARATWRKASLLVLLAMTTLALACVAEGGKRTPADSARYPVVAGTPAVEAGPDDTDIRDALFTVYYFAHVGDLPAEQAARLPADLRPTPEGLRRAAEVIAADVSKAGASRRWRAIVKLAAAGRDTGEYRDELVILGAPLQKIDEALKKHFDADRDTLEPILWQVLAGNPSFPLCTVGWPSVQVVPDWSTMTMHATMAIDVERTVPALAPVIDPQSWKRCGTFFDDSYVAQEVGYTVPLDPSDHAIPEPSPPTPGTDWNRLLFEEFRVGFLGLDLTWSRNLLGIRTESTVDEFRADYCLFDAVRSGYLGDSVDGGLDKDAGFLRVRKIDATWSRFEGHKTIRFFGRGPALDDQMNVWSFFLLHFSGAEIAELVCCP